MSWTTAEYLAGPPKSYYWEPAFTEYSAQLASAATASVARVASVLMEAALRAERLAFRLESSDRPASAESAIRDFLGPAYLELCEQVLDVFLGCAADWTAEGKATGAPQKKLVNLVEFLTAHGSRTAGAGYDPVVRRGLAHELAFRTGFAGTSREAVFRDDRGNEAVRTVADFGSELELLVDRALAYAFAFRLYALEKLTPKALELRLIEPELREWTAARYASTARMRVESATLDTVMGKRQVTVHTTDTSRAENERRVHLLHVVHRIGELYPDAQRVFVGLKGRNRLASWATCEGRDLAGWVVGKLSDEEFGSRLAPNLMLFPFARRGANWLFKWRFVAREARRTWHERRPKQAFRMLSVHDISTGVARRYRADVITTKLGTEQDIEDLISESVRLMRRKRVHRDATSARRWGRTPPHHVTVFVFSREKRPRDRWADPTAQFFVARAAWRDPRYRGQLPIDNLPDETSDGIEYQRGPRWTDARELVPRASS